MPPAPPQAPEPPAPRRALPWTALGVLLLLGLWQLAAAFADSLALASPLDTLSALARMGARPEFYRDFLVSFARILAGVALGGGAGFLLGIAAGLSRPLRQTLEPFRWLAMSVPPITVLVLIMLWLGMGTGMVVAMTGFLLAPIIYVNTVKGMDLVDRDLLQMARCYRFPPAMLLGHVYVPALAAPLLAGMVQVLSNGVRVVILAEVLGAHDGIGHAVAVANTNLEVAEVYAWVLVAVALVGGFEYLLLRPVQTRMLRWREP